MLAAARKDEKKEEALKNHVGHPITGRDCAFTLLNSPISHTQYPYVTGTSVLGIKYKDGVLLASDMGGSYGSTLRYKSVQRLKPIGKHTLLGAGGEISDFQEIIRYLDELILYDNMWDDGNSLGPKEVHNYLNRLMYNRRNKFNPLWNTLILGGVKNGQKYLGTVNMIGVHYEESHVATGFGNHLARPIFRDEWHEDMTFEEGVKLLEKCMLVLLYRDRSAVNKLRLESALRASETAQYALRKERENKRAAIYTNEEFSSLQCQELRDRLQNVQLEIEQLCKSVREKDIELDVAQKELEMQKKETGRWENRVSKLLEKHKSIDVEHYEHIKFEMQLLQCWIFKGWKISSLKS